MSKSLEALERYYSNLLYGNGGFGTDEEELEGLNAIKQDLERLEQLEKENQELKEQLKLSNESQETVINTMNLVSQENEKYQKIISILKDKRVNIDLLLNSSECLTYNFYAKKQDLEDLTQQEYEFAKEVLGE